VTTERIPPPTWNGSEWLCTLSLRSWREYLPSDGDVECVFLPGAQEPTPVQISTLTAFKSDEVAIRDAVLDAVRAHYDACRPKYVAFARKAPAFMGDPEVSMPERPDAAMFARLHLLQRLFLNETVLDGLTYVGLSFHAKWEPEHGLGVLVHGRRVVEVGGADTSFLEWNAENDARRAKQR